MSYTRPGIGTAPEARGTSCKITTQRICNGATLDMADMSIDQAGRLGVHLGHADTAVTAMTTVAVGCCMEAGPSWHAYHANVRAQSADGDMQPCFVVMHLGESDAVPVTERLGHFDAGWVKASACASRVRAPQGRCRLARRVSTSHVRSAVAGGGQGESRLQAITVGPAGNVDLRGEARRRHNKGPRGAASPQQRGG